MRVIFHLVESEWGVFPVQSRITRPRDIESINLNHCNHPSGARLGQELISHSPLMKEQCVSKSLAIRSVSQIPPTVVSRARINSKSKLAMVISISNSNAFG